jgi:hypothetical protein
MTHEASTPDPNQDLHLRRNVEAYLAERREWMADAVGICSDDRNRKRDPLEIFLAPPKPPEPRANAPDPGFTPGQETALRTVVARFGLGGEVDVPNGADYQVNEGGKARKIDAEAKVNQGARVIIFAGSPDRHIGEDEIEYMKKRLESDTALAESEYDMARQIAGWQEGFVPLGKPEVLPYGYDVDNDFALLREPTDQLVKIGKQNGAEVLQLRVDRGSKKFDTAAILGFISDMLSAEGDELSSVGMNTSTTYPSRAVDIVRAGLQHGRPFHVGMYGRHTLAAVERKSAAEPTAINQIPGELHVMQTKLLELQAAVDKKWPS